MFGIPQPLYAQVVTRKRPNGRKERMKAGEKRGGKEEMLNAGWPAGPKLETGMCCLRAAQRAPGGPPSVESALGLLA